jgi:hypothetical protein
MTDRKKQAVAIADNWGPALTRAVVEGDISDFRNLFATDEPVMIVVQNSEGNEAVFTIVDNNNDSVDGDEAAMSMTWEEFRQASAVDLEAQNYAKSEAQCLGVLGDRMILEVGRFNKDGFVYLEAYSLLTFDAEGKVTAVESFSDPQLSTLVAAAAQE